MDDMENIQETDRFQPVFVVGCPRSGTTLIGELVAACPHVFNGKESFFLYLMSNWRRMLRPPVAPLTEQFLDRASELMRQLIISETNSRRKRCYIDHTPWHALCLDEIWRIFETARVVNMVRHPADVVMSLRHSYEAGYAWAGATTGDRIALWARFARATQPREGDSRLRVIPYEEICTSPQREGRSLFSWLGLPWRDDYLQIFTKTHAPNPREPRAIAEKTRTVLSSAAIVANGAR
ncbi:MAG: sulfotransferase family protein [Pseudonocardiaceae bacterium]